jgi:plastocyanin
MDVCVFRHTRRQNGRRFLRALRRGLTGFPLAAFIASLILITPGCTSASGPQIKVRIEGNPLGNPDSFYLPATLHVRTGTTVTWVDRDDSEHTVTPNVNYPGWSGGSPILKKGQTYSFDFKRPGSYTYHCMVHPNMFGVVYVAKKGSS